MVWILLYLPLFIMCEGSWLTQYGEMLDIRLYMILQQTLLTTFVDPRWGPCLYCTAQLLCIIY